MKNAIYTDVLIRLNHYLRNSNNSPPFSLKPSQFVPFGYDHLNRGVGNISH
jgi:hypothetical protein